MPKFKLLALSNAVDGAADEFDRWYREQHLYDLRAIDGITGASMFKFAAGDERWKYLAIYDVETDDLASVMAEIGRRAGTELMPMTPAMARDTVYLGGFGDSFAVD